MDDNLIVYAAETPADLACLRAYVAGRGQAAMDALDRHLARPRYRAAFTRILEYAGAITGYALIGHERLRLGAATLEAGRLDALFVALEPPDQHADAALLGDCLRVLIEEGLPLALLDGLPIKYGAFGFAEYRLSSIVQCASGDHERRDTLRPLHDDDLEDVAALYDASYGQLPLTQLRAAPDWRYWLAGDRAALGLEDSRGRLVAYAVIAATASAAHATLHIAEAAAADAGAARSVCADLLGRAHRERYQKVDITVPAWHVVAQAALQLHATIALASPQPESYTQLAGVVDLPGVLEALAPEFERRLAHSRYAGWSGNLRVEIETERITLALDAGHATVIDGSRPADLRLRQVALPTLAQLCLGYRSAADLRATGGLACDDSALGLLDALFPVVMATI